MVKLIGKATINPFIFITGKFSGYIIWAMLFFQLLGVKFFQISIPVLAGYAAYLFLGVGIILTAVSLFNLGDSISLGLPSEKTLLKTRGIYKYSRNPMYLGFDMITLSSILFTLKPLIFILGLYSIIVYHFIILGEEKFLIARFDNSYLEYCKKVRRYI